MGTSLLNVRLDTELKKNAETLFSDLGLSMSTAINLFLRQAVRTGPVHPRGGSGLLRNP